MSQLSEAYEMQPSALPFNTTSDEDQSLKCWEEVKAETGFSTYKSFLKALEEKGLQYGDLLRELQRYGGRDDWCYSHEDSGTIFVVDILSDGSTSISLERQLCNAGYMKGPSFEDVMVQTDRKSITSLLQNLRSPPENVPARIVIWSMPWNAPLCPEAIDALGLGLNIHPSFFEALLSITKPSYESLPSFKPGLMKLSGSGHIRIGDNVTTVARNYLPGRRVPSVLIIAGSLNLHYASWENPHWKEFFYHSTVKDFLREEVVKMEISGSASLYRWATEHPRTHMDRTTSGPPNYYRQLFSKYVQKGCSFDSKDITPLWIAMLPLLHLEILRLRAQCGSVRSVMLQVQYGVEFPNKYCDLEKQYRYQVLDKQRFWLRRRLEALEEGKDCFVEFVRSQNAEEWLKSQTWLSQDESIREALAEAQTVDAEVRDYMQLQIGNLSILESRKSIQLSNQQYDEAKRTKILTILAFVYVPLNLTTSIFGMNLQQLNQSGRNIWSFLVTALVSLLVTGFTWFCIEQYNSVADWKRKREETEYPWSRGKAKHSIAIRVGILFGLIHDDSALEASFIVEQMITEMKYP